MSPQSRLAFLLVSNPEVLRKVGQFAKQWSLTVRNFEKADQMMAYSKENRPSVYLLDWDAREAESFQFLNEFAKSADLSKVPVIGFVSQNKANLVSEGERAGCDRVYVKTEFLRSLSDVLVRYAL